MRLSYPGKAILIEVGAGELAQHAALANSTGDVLAAAPYSTYVSRAVSSGNVKKTVLQCVFTWSAFSSTQALRGHAKIKSDRDLKQAAVQLLIKRARSQVLPATELSASCQQHPCSLLGSCIYIYLPHEPERCTDLHANGTQLCQSHTL